MDDLDPTCGKCHAPVTTGMMAMLCPYRETCEFWPDDPESQAFIKKYWPVPFGGSACEHEWQDGIYRPFEGIVVPNVCMKCGAERPVNDGIEIEVTEHSDSEHQTEAKP